MHKGCCAPTSGLVFSASPILIVRASDCGRQARGRLQGNIIITKNRLPMQLLVAGGFVSALQTSKIDKIWPTEEKGDDKGTWDLEYLAFFAQPLNDSDIQVKFYDITRAEEVTWPAIRSTRASAARASSARASSWPSRSSTSASTT